MKNCHWNICSYHEYCQNAIKLIRNLRIIRQRVFWLHQAPRLARTAKIAYYDDGKKIFAPKPAVWYNYAVVVVPIIDGQIHYHNYYSYHVITKLQKSRLNLWDRSSGARFGDFATWVKFQKFWAFFVGLVGKILKLLWPILCYWENFQWMAEYWTNILTIWSHCYWCGQLHLKGLVV